MDEAKAELLVESQNQKGTKVWMPQHAPLAFPKDRISWDVMNFFSLHLFLCFFQLFPVFLLEFISPVSF